MKLDFRRLLRHLSLSAEPGGGEQENALQSAVVRRIIQRIREVVKRRDLTVPLHSPSNVGREEREPVDPNTVAEYLDGALSPERAAEIEQQCLASDRYLAEMAACRQVLDSHSRAEAWAREEGVPEGGELPSPAAFRRMYGLLKARPADVEPRADDSCAQTVGVAGEREKRGQKFRRRRVVLAVSVVGLVCLFMSFWLLLRMGDGLTIRPPREPGNEGALFNRVAGDGVQNAQPIASDSSPGQAGEKGNGATGRLGRYIPTGSPSSLLRQQAVNNDKVWQPVPSESIVSIDDRLLTLPGFQGEIRLDSGVRLRLLGNLPSMQSPGNSPKQMDRELDGPFQVLESAVILRSTPDIDLDLELERGRITVMNDKPQGEARVRIRFSDETWDLTLEGRGSEAALELRRFFPSGSGMTKGPESEDPIAETHLIAIHGEVQLQIRYDSFSLHEPPGPASFSWNNVGAVSRAPQVIQRLPDWTNSPGVNESMQESLTSFEDQSGHQSPVNPLLKDFLKKSDKTSRVFAVYGLGAVDDVSALGDVLGDEKQFAEARRAAIVALQHWQGREAENDRKLFEVLKKKYSPSTAEIVLRLLHRFSEQQLKQPAVYASLIGYLQHVNLPVRQLAYEHLLALVPKGEAISYDPVAKLDDRQRAVEEWKKLVPEGTVPKK
jgi:hypothetical protein